MWIRQQATFRNLNPDRFVPIDAVSYPNREIKDSKERFLLEFIHDDEDEEDKKAKLKSLKVSKDLLECFKGSHRTITHTLSKTEMNEGKKLSAAKKNNKRKRTARGNSTVSELSI